MTSYMSLIAISVGLVAAMSANLAAEDQQVAAKAKEVDKNNVIDNNDEQETDAESFVMLGGGRFKIISKTFTPPDTYTFKVFPGTETHVDIKSDPQVNGERPIDKDTQIKIRGTFLATNAGIFPLSGEGNLKTIGSGGSGGESTPPEFHWAAKVRDIKVDLEIFRGQSGAVVSEADEETIGSFTVANMNDTNNNGAIDATEATVAGEVDLMKMIVKKPDPDLGGKVTLKKLGGAAKVWLTPTKDTEVTLDVEYSTSELPKTLWVEGIAPSGAVRDIAFELIYKGKTDTVKATSIWATMTEMKNQPTQPLWADVQDPLKNTFLTVVGGKFGSALGPAPVGVRKVIGLQFTMAPTGVGAEPGVAIDVTRQVESGAWFVDAGVVVDRRLRTFSGGDTANDDSPDEIDEDVVPPNDRVYSLDGPGIAMFLAVSDEFIQRLNAREYIRVRVDGTRPSGDVLSGSRASDKTLWHMQTWVRKSTFDMWELSPGKPNDVDLGHVLIGGAP